MAGVRVGEGAACHKSLELKAFLQAGQHNGLTRTAVPPVFDREHNSEHSSHTLRVK